MANITIFGTGGLGTAIASVFTAGGHSVQTINTSTPKASIKGDIVVLAVPHPAIAEIVAEYGQQFDGRIVIDPSNPVDFSTFDRLVVPADSSAAADLAASLPGATIVKALNTNFAPTLTAGEIGGTKPTVLIAGNDARAKRTVASVLEASGMVSTIDAGQLIRARELEAMGFLQLQFALAKQVPFTGGFALYR